MLRDNILVVLEEVVLRCQEAAEDYAAAGQEVEDRELTQLFAFLEAERRTMVGRLSDTLRDGNHPLRSHHPSSTVQRWMTRLRAAFTIDRRVIMLEECERSEQLLGEAMVRALGAPLPGEARRMLTYFEADVTAARGRLQAIRTRIRSV